jgi:hypothetical protein
MLVQDPGFEPGSDTVSGTAAVAVLLVLDGPGPRTRTGIIRLLRAVHLPILLVQVGAHPGGRTRKTLPPQGSASADSARRASWSCVRGSNLLPRAYQARAHPHEPPQDGLADRT